MWKVEFQNSRNKWVVWSENLMFGSAIEDAKMLIRDARGVRLTEVLVGRIFEAKTLDELTKKTEGLVGT